MIGSCRLNALCWSNCHRRQVVYSKSVAAQVSLPWASPRPATGSWPSTPRHLADRDPDAPESLATCLRDWQHDHAGLHGYSAMRRELDRRFGERYFCWLPYLYGEFGDPSLEAEERRLIDAGEIEATGFRYVGERIAATA